jgi:hypothetical protein
MESPRETAFGDEAKNLAPGFLEAANVPPPTKRHITIAHEEMAEQASLGPRIGLEYNVADVPLRTQMSVTTLSKLQTEKINAAEKRRHTLLIPS